MKGSSKTKKNKFKDRKVKLLDTTIYIKFEDEAKNDDNWVFGYTEFNGDTSMIHISIKDRNGKSLSETCIRRTLRHELFHAIMNKGMYFNSSEDEPLVEWLAQCTDMLWEQGETI